MSRISIGFKLSLVLVALVVSLAVTACVRPGTPSTLVTTPANAFTVNLAADAMKFDLTQITVPEGTTVVVKFENKEAIPHNFSVYQNLSGGQTKAIYIGKVITGPATITYTFPAPPSSESYFFMCDIHPQTMYGTFTVTKP